MPRDRTSRGEASTPKPGCDGTINGGGVRSRESVAAWKRVRQNKGSPGIDGMTIDDARDYLHEHWPSIRSQLLDGIYQPLAGQAGRNSQAGRRGQKARRALRRRPTDPASPAAGSPGAVGPNVLRAQLRLPAGAIRSPGGGPGTAVHRRGLRWWSILISKNFSTGSITTA